MKHFTSRFLCLLLLISPTLSAQQANQGMGPLLDDATVKPGDQIPTDLVIYTADGEQTTLAAIAKDKHTVLVSGCLTCPIFHRTYPSVEAVYADYKNRDDIQFFFMYKSLAHPELNGYVQPATLDERLTHIVEAKRVLGTTIPWLCDGTDNAVRHALGFGPNTQIVINPEGEVVHALGWSDGEILREQLVGFVGKTDTTTRVADLELKRGKPFRNQRSYQKGVLEKPTFTSELIPIKIAPIESANSPLYVKPRLEVSRNVLSRGSGELYLGFFLDPIHHVHWNNLAAPLKYEFTLPDGTVISPKKAMSPKVDQDADSDPREFALAVTSIGDAKTAELAIHYFACSDEEGWCVPVTQKYSIAFERDLDGGGTNGRSFRTAGGAGRGQGGPGGRGGPGGGQRGGPGRGQPPGGQQLKQRIMEMDTDGNGSISRDEATGRLRQDFGDFDSNDDGKIDDSEIDRISRNPPQPDGGQRGGPGGRQPGGQGQFNPQAIKERIMESDANADGKITREELPEQMRQRFDRMDANGDGHVDEAEVDAMLQNRPQGGPQRPGQGNRRI